MELNIYQKKAIQASDPHILCLSSAAAGKALKNGSKIYTSNGPINIEDAQIGQEIYGEDGKLHSITGVFPQGKKKEYKVTLSDGTEIRCCDEHLWSFQTESMRSQKSNKLITCTLREIIEKYPLFKPARAKNNFGTSECKRKNVFLPMTKPIDFPEKKLLIDPYTFGALLGDGSFCNSLFTNADEDVIKWVDEGLNKIGCHLKYKDRYDYTINSNGTTVFSDILKHYNLWKVHSGDKFIPPEYKYNSIENRLKLLQGLIDTDGSCEGSAYDITLKSKQLILDCKEMCESLGLTAVYSEKSAICTNSATGRKDCGIVYRLRIKTSKLITKLHCSQRREKQWKPSKVYSHRAIIAIEPTGEEVEMTCIQVDNPTSLFVTDNFVVTHNTRVLTERIRYLLEEKKVSPTDIVAITFTKLAAEEMHKRLGKIAEGVFIGTIHSYAKFICDMNGVDLQFYLQKEQFDKILQEAIYIDPDKYPKVKHLLIDECQDVTELEHMFLSCIPAENDFYVGDDRQEIYQFKGSSDEYLRNMYYSPRYAKYPLIYNYRNAPNIIDFANDFLGSYDALSMPSTAVKWEDGYIEQNTFSNCVTALYETDSYGSWAILCRTNAQVEYVQDYLAKMDIPYITFKRADLNLDDLDMMMAENRVKILTIHVAKGLEWPNVIVVGAKVFSLEERKISYVAATRAQDNLYWCPSPIGRKQKKSRTHVQGKLMSKTVYDSDSNGVIKF